MVTPTRRNGTAPVSGGVTASPSDTVIGDLVVVYTWERAGAGIPTHTVDTGNGFVEILSHGHNDGSTDGRLSVAYKIATAGGTQNYQAYTTGTGSPSWFTGCIVITKDTYSVATLPTSTGISSTTNVIPDPPAVSGLTAGFPYHIITIAAWHLGSSLTTTPTVPSGYGNLQHISGAATSELACASLGVSGSTSYNPGTFGDDQAPNGTCSITFAIQGAPPEEGFGIPALVLGTSGAGQASKYGLGVPALVLGSTGAGQSVHYGLGAPALTLGTEGAGQSVHYGLGVPDLDLAATGEGDVPVEPPSEGFGVPALVLGSTGAGQSVHYGLGAPALVLSTTGAGQASQYGFGIPTLTLSSMGAGQSVHYGTGATDLALASEGAGQSVHYGFGIPSLTLDAFAAGQSIHQGFSVQVLVLGAEGDGVVPSILPKEGSGSIDLVLDAEAHGQIDANGWAIPVLNLNAWSISRTEHYGTSVPALTLDLVGFGHQSMTGFSAAVLTLSAEGSGQKTSYGLALAELQLGATGVGEAPIAGVSDGGGAAVLFVVARGIGEAEYFGYGSANLNLDVFNEFIIPPLGGSTVVPLGRATTARALGNRYSTRRSM